ncbi:MAG: hypothetical protein N3A57_07775 [Negativicutes bacterium]|nr:hypothetical protein [Negativicutes bacterium]
MPLLPEITAAIEPGLAGWRRRDLVRFNRIMSEANRALRDQDWVMLRDLLHFELRRLFTR